ncbi:MAG: hypothetical protein K2G41_01810 [Duncaniella sp.]|uniref:hypothetical protein n=1 Tax=Duncaniella sp. TaxID=2518496 RepID=UPI0023BF8C47|nr:hypothetical protein [Duncaniella sp.]MDE6089414.1 hypothetical protein [Duncaniella sp.]
MIIRHISSGQNIKSILASVNTYFIVENDIVLGGEKYVLGAGSVIEFSGGSFRGITGSSLDLNDGSIIAGAYPIFSNLDVSGFSNCSVRAEWFRNYECKDGDQIHINLALIAARGCPVVLEAKDYILTGPIVFPELPDSARSTLISPGKLIIKDNLGVSDPVAIDINVSNVLLQIKNIEGYNRYYDEGPKHDGEDYGGIGIRLSKEVYNVDIDVYSLGGLHRGIEILPGNGGETSVGIQYLNIRFQRIYADCGIYIDIFKNSNKYRTTWFSHANISGGRLQGYHGIYFADPSVGKIDDNERISNLKFINIGFEELYGIPIRLRNLIHVEFVRIRMAESLYNYTWIDMKNVAWVRFSVTGLFDPVHYVADGECDNIIMRGPVIERRDWNRDSFDMIIIDSLWKAPEISGLAGLSAPQMVVTKSIQPYQMSKLVEESLNLRELFPEIDNTYDGRIAKFSVLPRILQFKVKGKKVINLSGLRNFTPCIYYFYADIAENGELELKSDDNEGNSNMPTRFVENLDWKETRPSVSIKESGLYQMIWSVSSTPPTNNEATKWAACVLKVG